MTAFIFVILGLLQLTQQQGNWQVVEATRYEWDKNAGAQVFVLEQRNDTEFRVRIETPGHADLVLPIACGFVRLRDDVFVNKQLIADNLLSSSYLYLSPTLKDRYGRPMLVVFGDAVASDPGSLKIVALDRTGVPRVVFSSERFLLTDIKDLDKDGRPEIIGQHSISQAVGAHITTYDPASVYRLSRQTDKAVFSLALSKAYNLKNYGWAGPNSSEKFAVVWCTSSDKPVVMSTERALRLYRGCLQD